MVYRNTWAVATLLVGLWIAFAPFSRPLPGGEPFSFESTPEIQCKSPVVGVFGSNQPSAEVFTVPRPSAGDPTTSLFVDCTSRARFRLALGGFLSVAAVIALAAVRRPNRSTRTQS